MQESTSQLISLTLFKLNVPEHSLFGPEIQKIKAAKLVERRGIARNVALRDKLCGYAVSYLKVNIGY